MCLFAPWFAFACMFYTLTAHLCKHDAVVILVHVGRNGLLVAVNGRQEGLHRQSRLSDSDHCRLLAYDMAGADKSRCNGDKLEWKWQGALTDYILYTRWRNKNRATSHPTSLQIFRKLHDQIAWKLVDFCNIILNTAINFLYKNFIALWRHLAKTPLLSFIHNVQIDFSITQ